jgi:hypothetical protein
MAPIPPAPAPIDDAAGEDGLDLLRRQPVLCGARAVPLFEMPFSKLKAFLRKVAERTVPRLCRRIGLFARSLTAREARNYLRHAGYA